MNVVKSFDWGDGDFERAYVEESLIADAQHEICKLMAEKKISRAELARRMDVSAAYITQLLGDGGSNLTLRTMARVYLALGEKCRIGRCDDARGREYGRSKSPSKDGWIDVVAYESWSVESSTDQEASSAANDRGVVVWLDAVRRKAA